MGKTKTLLEQMYSIEFYSPLQNQKFDMEAEEWIHYSHGCYTHGVDPQQLNDES